MLRTNWTLSCAPEWDDDSSTHKCTACSVEFSLFTRKVRTLMVKDSHERREKREKRELIAENKWEKGSSNKAYARCGLRSYLQLIAFSITAETAGIRTLSSPPSPLLSPASSSLSLYLFSLPLTLLLLHTRASHTCLNGRTHLRQIFLCVLCVCVCVCVWSCCISFAKVCSQLVACLMC